LRPVWTRYASDGIRAESLNRRSKPHARLSVGLAGRRPALAGERTDAITFCLGYNRQTDETGGARRMPNALRRRLIIG
jgi:hypothetical protein